MSPVRRARRPCRPRGFMWADGQVHLRLWSRSLCACQSWFFIFHFFPILAGVSHSSGSLMIMMPLLPFTVTRTSITKSPVESLLRLQPSANTTGRIDVVALCVSANHGYAATWCFSKLDFIFYVWQCCVYALVRLRYKTTLWFRLGKIMFCLRKVKV